MVEVKAKAKVENWAKTKSVPIFENLQLSQAPTLVLPHREAFIENMPY
jgi:hypothetical protein